MCYYSRKYDQILSQRVECTENCEQMHGAEKAKFSIDDFTSALFRQKSTKDSISQHVVAQDDSDPGESPDDRDSPSSGNDSDKDGPSPGGNSGLGDDDVPGFDVPHSDGNGNPRRDVVQDQAGDDPPSGRCNYPRPDDGLSSSDETDILNDDCINEQFTSLDGSTNTDLNCLATTTLGDVSKYVSGVKRRKHPDNKRRGRKKNKQNKRKLKEQKCCHPFTSFQESGTCIALSKQLCFPSSTFVRAISSHVPNTNMVYLAILLNVYSCFL
ncbi:unnamed protein product [Allacma fusca]|uniref:Uncharacterized protein n=1 Tax=Allacma fusca TaxID=39272 RepID=A0A8J2KNP2_9HEXA|nr:unnamed protein product [Allacma fusca]